MHHLQAEQTASHLAHGSQPAADRELRHLRTVEVQKPQHDAPGSVIDLDLQHASGARDDLVADDLAGHLADISRTDLADSDDAGFILVAQRQMEDEIGFGANAQPGKSGEFGHGTTRLRGRGRTGAGRPGSTQGSTITASASKAAPRGKLATPTVERAG